MIKLNLLPPKEKKEAQLNKISRWMTFFCASLLTLVIFFTLLCFSSYVNLTILLNAQQKQIEIAKSDAKGQELEEIETKIIGVKQQISKVADLQQQFVCWTPILEEITRLLPNGINLEKLTLRSDSTQIELHGHAGIREQVINFSDAIAANDLFVGFDPPLSNLVSKEDIDFIFDFKINTSTASCHFQE